MHPHDFIFLISGTNRPGSTTLLVSRRIEQLYREAQFRVELFSLEDLPPEMFRPEAYKAKPPALLAIQEKVLDAAGLHVVLPEYNGSFPGVLKYFIDLLKFPDSFERKPVAFVGVTSGSYGAMRAVEQMQMVFGYRNAHLYPERVFISGVSNKFTPDGAVNDAAIDERLSRQARGFAQFCGLFSRNKNQGV
jgi:chromate reductase, NAD(P)H dehydrogenase (quinone)